MNKRLRRLVAMVLLCVMLLTAFPTVNVVAAGEKASSGMRVSASWPPIVQAASVLKIPAAQVLALREDILRALLAFESECNVEKYGIIYNAKVNDCLSELIKNTMPEVFQANSWMFYSNPHKGSVLTRIGFPNYLYQATAYRKMMSECEAVVEQMTQDLVSSDLSQARKALLLHDRLAVWVEYDKAATLLGNAPHIDHTMYGALCDRSAVCDGYAEAYMYLLQRVGIESYICRSNQLHHAWNIVKIDGKWYHVDVTEDDPTWDVTGRVNHKNFLISSNALYVGGHQATDYDTTPTDTKYETSNWPWQTSNTAFQYLGGRMYYIDNAKGTLGCWEGNKLYTVADVNDTWWVSANQYYPSNYARLSADERYLYYTLSKAVYRYDPITGETKRFHSPKFTNRPYHNIYGMKVEAGVLYYEVTDTPAYDAVTKRWRQERVPYSTKNVTGISIEQLPQKCEYRKGDELDTSGLRIRVQYSNKTVESLSSGFVVEGFKTTVTGEQALTVRYAGKTATFTVSVTDKTAGGNGQTLGNVDGDEKITSTDARMVLQYVVRKIGADKLDVRAADVNCDGKVDSTDARLILQLVVGKINSF